jgi:hypothetical protein
MTHQNENTLISKLAEKRLEVIPNCMYFDQQYHASGKVQVSSSRKE